MKANPYQILLCIVGALVLSACAGPAATPGAPLETPVAAPLATALPAALTVMTHDSFAVSENLIAQFEQENNVKITFLKSGDTGGALNRAILSKENPRAVVFYGVDNTFLSGAREGGHLGAGEHLGPSS